MEIEAKKVWFQEDRENLEWSPFGIHWEKLDQDLSFEGFLSFSKQHA